MTPSQSGSLVRSASRQASLWLCWKTWISPIWKDQLHPQTWPVGKMTDGLDKWLRTQKAGQGNSATTVTATRGCWEEEGLRPMVGLSPSEPGGPQGKSQHRERGTLTDSQEFFPPSDTQTESYRAAKRTLVHRGDRGREGGREGGGRSDSYNNTARRSTSYPVSLVRPLAVNALYRQTLCCLGYSVVQARTEHSSRHVWPVRNFK